LQVWTQTYDPLGTLWLSALAALIPIIFFFIALTVFNLKGHVAGALTALLAVVIAVAVYGMPLQQAIAALADGFAFGLWPIAWIVIGAVFLFKLTVKTGRFEIIRCSIMAVTSDQRLQALLIAFSFGAFLEGAAGFGAPVAITSALLAGLGFDPLYAAGLCLIANTAPVAFGAMGIPILVAASVSALDPFKVGAEAGRVLSILILFAPFWIIAVMDGWRGIKETFPAALAAGVSFVVGMAVSSNFIGPEPLAIIGSILSLACLALFLKLWRPKHVFRFAEARRAPTETERHAAGEILGAWLPFIILTVVEALAVVRGAQFVERPRGDQLAMVDHHDMRADARDLVHQMGRKQHGLPLSGEIVNEVVEQARRFDVEPVGRLVEDQEIWVMQQREQQPEFFFMPRENSSAKLSISSVSCRRSISGAIRFIVAATSRPCMPALSCSVSRAERKV